MLHHLVLGRLAEQLLDGALALDEGGNDLGIEVSRRAFENLGLRVFEGARGAIGAVGRHGVERVSHRQDAGPQVQEIREEVLKLRSLLHDHPDLYHTGTVENAMQEACEAFLVHAILEAEGLPSPKELGVTDTAYLLGLGDVVGELRRFSLEHLRQGDIKLASAYLEKMERILDALMRFDYPTALVALKRKQDVARSLIEKTRGEVAVAARSQELADKLDAVRGKL